MKRQSIQKKRRPTSSGLFVFHSKTKRRKKQRVAASADLGSEVPNLGVARALFVILVLHVAAIAAIFIHNRVTDEDAVATASDAPAAASAAAGSSQDSIPRPKTGEDYYFVSTGDTYPRIAQNRGVDVNELRDLNNNKQLKAGRILRIPPGGIAPVSKPVAAATAEAEAEAEAVNPAPQPPPPSPTLVRPIADTPQSATAGVAAGELPIVVKRTEPAQALRVEVDAPEPTLVRPSSHPPAVAPAVVVPASPAPAPAPVPAAGGSYTVKSGDTAWGIARRHKVSVDSLLKANGISDARKLRIGMKLRIPAN